LTAVPSHRPERRISGLRYDRSVIDDEGDAARRGDQPLGDELEVALEAARRAGAIQMALFRRLERIEKKSEKDVVTEADHLSEEAIIATIRERFPGDLFLAEESGHSASGGRHGAAGGAAAEVVVGAEHRIWIIDPLDGTVNYANGLPIFCVSIALAIGGRPTVGVVLDPTRGEASTAVRGHGAALDGAPVRHAPKERLVDLLVMSALPQTRFARRETRVRRATRVTRILGSAALSLAYVSDGRFDAYIQARGLSLWDIAAAGLIAEEAGVLVTDLEGGPWFDLRHRSHSIGLVAAAPAHHAALLDLLR
jgi:myo-inositol-1(or 4)-monophosphatase